MTDPTAADLTVSVTMVAQLVEVLHHLEVFLTVNGVARAELVEYCFPRPGLTAGGLVDQLAWQHLYLDTRLTETATSTPQTGSARQDQRHD